MIYSHRTFCILSDRLIIEGVFSAFKKFQFISSNVVIWGIEAVALTHAVFYLV